MSEIPKPLIGIHIDMPWHKRLVLNHEEAEKLVEILNRSVLLEGADYDLDHVKVINWSENKITYRAITDHELAAVRMNSPIS